MQKDLTWDNAREIGILLSRAIPDRNPLDVSLGDLHRYVTELNGFKDDPTKSTPKNLEAIQTAWQEEFLDRTQG